MLESEKMLSQGERPIVMCPLNDDGLCSLYKHRMMICRLHGVPSSMTRPDGQKMEFPGCFRCQEIVADQDVDHLDRTRMSPGGTCTTNGGYIPSIQVFGYPIFPVCLT